MTCVASCCSGCHGDGDSVNDDVISCEVRLLQYDAGNDLHESTRARLWVGTLWTKRHNGLYCEIQLEFELNSVNCNLTLDHVIFLNVVLVSRIVQLYKHQIACKLFSCCYVISSRLLVNNVTLTLDANFAIWVQFSYKASCARPGFARPG